MQLARPVFKGMVLRYMDVVNWVTLDMFVPGLPPPDEDLPAEYVDVYFGFELYRLELRVDSCVFFAFVLLAPLCL